MKNKKKNNHQSGFTLIEVIVVCVILGILTGLAIGALGLYQRSATFRKNNEYAQTLFGAAQTAFSQKKEAGQLENLVEKMKTEKNNQLTPDMITGGAKSQMQAVPENRLFYFIYEKGRSTYDPNVKEEEKTADQIVYEMIEPYVYDADVLNATFCVEFDPEDGVVWAVLYNSRASQFHYGKGESTEENNGITDRNTGARSHVLLGYYGVDMLSAKAPAARVKNLIQNMKLENGETLELQWNLNPKYKGRGNYTYTIRLYDAETKKLACSFKVNDKQKHGNVITNQMDASIISDVTTYTYAKDGTKTKTELAGTNFAAYVDKDENYHLILDGVDLDAATKMNDDKQNIYQATYSIKRLLTSAEDIYVRMQAVGEKYQSSSWKQTQSESAYFGKTVITTNPDKKEKIRTCDIENARHLFNIRFTEKENEVSKEKYVYQQTKDVAWDWDGKDQGILQHKKVYDKQKKVPYNPKNVAFPAIEKLQKNSVYKSKENDKNQTITGLVLKERKNQESDSNPLGLFGVNEGRIQDITFQSATVEGMRYVGTVCGVNYGELAHITVNETSKITGHNYVGGIAGSDITGRPITPPTAGSGEESSYRFENKRSYQNLENKASVEGNSYVGGIVGYLHGIYGTNLTNPTIITVDTCKNTGLIQSTDRNGICIGGIAGYNEDSILKGCTNGTTFTKAQEGQLADTAGREQLKGNFVGGIVGLDVKGQFVQCTSGIKEGENRFHDYVIGRNFVGGIVGFHAKEVTDTVTVPSGLPDKEGTAITGNHTNVVGESYVGGVTGVVGKLKGPLASLLKLNGTSIDAVMVSEEIITDGGASRWENTGVVAATKAYAGGITGYNSGILLGCTTQTQPDAGLIAFIQSFTKNVEKGDYIGGITGYNCGQIYTIDENISSVVIGNDYVGGTVGYNEVNGTVSQQQVNGSYASGNDFVGGHVGLNRNPDLLLTTSTQMVMRPSRVDGRLYVGGVLGGNIVTGGKTNKCYVDNPKGTVEGLAFVGGFIGYNKVVNAAYDATEITGPLSHVSLWDEQNEFSIMGVANQVRGLDGTAEYQDSPLIIQGDLNTPVDSKFGQVTAGIYGGGILGYNAGVSNVLVQNITSQTPIETKYVVVEEGDYSYAGGIIGEVSPNMTIIHCENTASNQLHSPGAVALGGITECNRGTIQNCRAYTIGTNERERVGGIAGVNKALIRGCDVNVIFGSQTVQGKNVVGGIVAQNYGRVENCTNQGNINGGTNKGGIIGQALQGSVTTGCVNEGNITADQNSGGIIGQVMQGATVESCSNKGAVTANQNSGGGIIGSVAGLTETLMVTGCYNQGAITGFGSLGGVVGTMTENVNIATIQNCVNVGTVQDNASGTCAGILGKTDGTANVAMNANRNYGTSPQPITGGNRTFSGIIGTASSNATLTGNFGVAGWTMNPNGTLPNQLVVGCAYPITNSRTVVDKGNYYFTDEKPTKNPQVTTTGATISNAWGPITPETSVMNMFDGKNDTSCEYNGAQYNSATSNIFLDFDGEYPIKTIRMIWGGEPSQKEYSIVVYDKTAEYINRKGIGTANGEDYTEIFISQPFTTNRMVVQIDAKNSSKKVNIAEIRINGQQVIPFFSGKSQVLELLQGSSRVMDSKKGLGTKLYVKQKKKSWDITDNKGKVLIPDLTSNPTDLEFNGNIAQVDIDADKQTPINSRYAMYQSIDGQLLAYLGESKNPGRRQNNTPSKKVEYGQIPQPTAQLADLNKDAYTYHISWQPYVIEEELAELDYYMVTVEDQDKKVPTVQYQGTPEQSSLEADLEAFAGKTVEISVCAKAKADAVVYQDAPKGVKYVMNLPKRVETPDVGQLKVESQETSQEAFIQEGIQIAMTNAKNKATGHYRMRAALYADREKTNLIADLGEMEMNGNLQAGECKLMGISPDDAGHYLVIQVKGISEKNMNSQWSAEGIYPLSTIKVTTPNMTEIQETRTYKELQTQDVSGVITSREVEKSVEQNALAWEYDKYVGTYGIDITPFPWNHLQEQFHLRVTKNPEGEPFTITKLTDRMNPDGTPIWEGLPTVPELVVDYPNELEESNTRIYSYAFGYQREQIGTAVLEDGTSYEYQIVPQGYVECVEYTKKDMETKYSFRLVMPDVTTDAGLHGIYGTDNRNYLFTNAVTVTTESIDGARYANSRPMKWWRETDVNGNPITKIEEQK